MARKLNGIELTRYDDLFKTDAEREADQQERVQIVPAEQVFPYARQPYSVDRPSADLVRLMDSIERTGMRYERAKGKLRAAHYRKAFAGVLAPNMTLEELYRKHNADTRPFYRQMRSLSESDVIVVKRGSKRNAYYVDAVGFQEVPSFLKRLQKLKERGEAR